jgi:hypothetical protein
MESLELLVVRNTRKCPGFVPGSRSGTPSQQTSQPALRQLVLLSYSPYVFWTKKAVFPSVDLKGSIKGYPTTSM